MALRSMSNRIEIIASIAAVSLVVIGCLVVLRPFVSSALWAAVLCYATWPVFTRLDRLLKKRRSLAAFSMTLLIGIVLVTPFLIVGITLAENVSRIDDLSRLVKWGLLRETPAWVKSLPGVGPYADRYWADFVSDTARISEFATSTAASVGKWLLEHSLDFGKGILQLTLSVIIAFFFYRDGEQVVARIAAGGRRLAGDRTQRIIGIVGQTIKGVVYGILGTGLAQGFMAGLGFWIADVPSAFFLALLTFALSFIPLGPPLIWIPVSIWLFQHEQQAGWGVFMLIWGVIGISGIDNIVRPLLISYRARMSFITIFLGAVGGVVAFGFIGIFLGPTLLAVGLSLLQEFTSERAAKSAPASPPQSQPSPSLKSEISDPKSQI